MQLTERTKQAIILNAELTFLELKEEFLRIKNNTNTFEKLIELCEHFCANCDVNNDVDYEREHCKLDRMFNFMYKNLQATIDFSSSEIYLCGSVDIKYSDDKWLDNITMYNVL